MISVTGETGCFMMYLQIDASLRPATAFGISYEASCENVKYRPKSIVCHGLVVNANDLDCRGLMPSVADIDGAILSRNPSAALIPYIASKIPQEQAIKCAPFGKPKP
jgi:hypothetical protein